MDNDVFYLSIYDTLKYCERGINSIYKVFFFRVIIFDYNDVQDSYDVFLFIYYSSSFFRFSSSDSQKVDFVYSLQDVYDVFFIIYFSVFRMGDVFLRFFSLKFYV